MRVLVNGEPRELERGTTVTELVTVLGLADRRIAVEINEAIVPRSTFDSHAVEPDDRIEIVHAIGGG